MKSGTAAIRSLCQGVFLAFLLLVPAVDALAGGGRFESTDGSGNLKLRSQHNGLRRTWTHIIPGKFGGSFGDDLFFYDNATGQGEFYTRNAKGVLVLLSGSTGPTGPWTHIIPGAFTANYHPYSNSTDLLFYDARTGVGEFFSTTAHGGLVFVSKLVFPPKPVSQSFTFGQNPGPMTLAKPGPGVFTAVPFRTWTHIIPGKIGGVFDSLFFYDAAAGVGEFYMMDGWGNLTLLREHAGLRTTWTHIIPGHFGGHSSWTDLFFYDATAGEGEFYSNDYSDLKWLRGYREAPPPPNPGPEGVLYHRWTHIVPIYLGGGDTDLFFYNAPLGWGRTTNSQLGGPQGLVLQQYTGLHPHWTHIIPGHFVGGGSLGWRIYEDLFFFDPTWNSCSTASMPGQLLSITDQTVQAIAAALASSGEARVAIVPPSEWDALLMVVKDGAPLGVAPTEVQVTFDSDASWAKEISAWNSCSGTKFATLSQSGPNVQPVTVRFNSDEADTLVFSKPAGPFANWYDLFHFDPPYLFWAVVAGKAVTFTWICDYCVAASP